jgi:outer membrane scaffolding protein for murein synthesis (MipA/OmpV family)
MIPFGSVWAQDEEISSSQTDGQKPLWEAGALAAAFTLPHYVGSDEYYTFAFPFPYIIYRGEFLQADRDGVRGLFFYSDRIEFDISTGGNLPVSSDSNEAHKDMPELDALLEIGPAIRYYIYRRGALDHLYLEAAWRGAVSFEFNGGLDIGVDYRGYRSTLGLTYKNESLFQDNDLTFYLSTGISYADNILNGYFYDVATEFVTPDRGLFDADAGYAGLHLACVAIKDLSERWSIGGVASWRNINGAVFEESPLVRTSNNYYGSVFLIWKFARSKVLLPDEKS